MPWQTTDKSTSSTKTIAARVKPSHETNHQKGKEATKRKNTDKLTNPNLNVGDVVVDCRSAMSSYQIEVP